MSKDRGYFKCSLPIVILIASLGSFIYTRIYGYPFKLMTVEEMLVYGPIALPFLYIANYIIRAGFALVFAFLMAGMISELAPKQKLINVLSSTRRCSYLLAAFLAPLLTVCSCVMIPIFTGLLYAGIGIDPAITFLMTAPAANIMTILFTASIISWKIAFARFIGTISITIVTGYIVAKTSWGRSVEGKYRVIINKRRDIEEIKLPLYEKLWNSLIMAGYLAKKMLPFILLGIGVVSYIQAYIPPQIIVKYLTGVQGIIMGAIIGVSMYTPTLVEVILVDALKHMGMSAPAALAFLIGGPMTSIPSMLGVSRIVGWRIDSIYAILAVIGAITIGLIYYILLRDLW